MKLLGSKKGSVLVSILLILGLFAIGYGAFELTIGHINYIRQVQAESNYNDIQNICKIEIQQIEKDGYLTAEERQLIESKVSKYDRFDITGTASKVDRGKTVFLHLVVKETNKFLGIINLVEANVTATGTAK